MKAVILAGGEGRRLKPITDKMPKPLAPINGLPAIKLIIKQLYNAGIREAAITTAYLASTIEDALGSECEGVKLSYFEEKIPLGTAGGVLLTRDFIGDDDFIVMSGDAVNELNIASAAEKRRELNTDALILLSRSPEPGEYGVVICDEDGRIKSFSEKPSLSSTYTNTVNTGIYLFSNKIFDLIPPEKDYDFGKDLFPSMLENNIPMYGLVDTAYWCDIGDIDSYYLANMRKSENRTVIGRGCSLGRSKIRSSVLMNGVTVGDGCIIERAIICSGTVIGDGAIIGSGAVIGQDSVIEKGSVIPEGTRLPAESSVKGGVSVGKRRLFSTNSKAAELFFSDGLRIEKDRLSAALSVKLGGSFAAASNGGRIGIMHDGEKLSEKTAVAISRGVSVSGGRAVFFGEGFEAEASFAASALSLDLSVFIRNHDKYIDVLLFDSLGLYPKRELERRIISSLSDENVIAKERKLISSVPDFEKKFYFPMLVKNRVRLDGLPFYTAKENRASELLKEALFACGGSFDKGGLGLSVSDDGFRLSALQNGFTADDWHIKALILKYLIRGDAVLPIDSPIILSDICRGRLRFFSHCPSGIGEDTLRESVSSFPELRHACAAALELAGLISASGKSLSLLSERIPRFVFSREAVKLADPARLSVLSMLGSPDGDGVKADYSKGSVRIVASRNGFILSAEAAAGEYAEEILDISKKDIEKYLKGQPN